MTRRKMTRLEQLEAALPDGWHVATYSPGGAPTRYRFYRGAPGSYFSVRDEHTAMGFAAAERFASGLGSASGPTYKIVRMYADRDKRPHAVKGLSGLTLKEAQAHCSDPETSSSTCKSAAGKARTRQHGAWFDGYEVE